MRKMVATAVCVGLFTGYAHAQSIQQRQQERDSASPLEGEHDWKIRTGLRAYLA